MRSNSHGRGTAVLALALAALFSACGDSTTPDNGPAEILLSAADTLRYLGATTSVGAIIRSANHQEIAGATISSWESSNTSVVTIDATTGLMTAVGNGVATITAHAGRAKGSTPAVVLQAPVSVTLVAPTDTLRSIAATGQYTAVVKDAGSNVIASPGARWSSTNTAIVTMDSVQGVATAVANGAAYVRARANLAIDSLPLAVHQRIDPSKSTITVVRPLLFVDDMVRVTVQARDALNNPLAFGGANVAISAQGGSSSGSFQPVVDDQAGSYAADFTGATVGTPLIITATIDGAAVTSALPTLRVVGFTRISAAGSSITSAQGTTTGGFTCGIITTGDMYCWGISVFGVRGDGTPGNGGSGPVPTLVGGQHPWTELDMGLMFVCGVATGGTVYCWGDGDVGQIGNGNFGNPPDVRIPTATSGNGTYGTVSIGDGGGACSMTLTGAAMCWGSGTLGRLGNGGEALSAVPTAVSGGLSFSALSTSDFGTCGIAGGNAYCWGAYQVLGAPPPDTCTQGVACAKTPIAVSGGHTFRPIIAVDGNVVCAAATDDQTYCWGSGYLGNGSLGATATPTVVSGGLSFTTLSASSVFHCGIVASGAAYCWGQNRNGRVGDGTTTDALVPTAVSGGHAFTQLTSSQDHTCGVATDGNAYCWGGNDMGELGDRTTTPSKTPVKVKLFAP